jgi:hypothetical protein
VLLNKGIYFRDFRIVLHEHLLSMLLGFKVFETTKEYLGHIKEINEINKINVRNILLFKFNINFNNKFS